MPKRRRAIRSDSMPDRVQGPRSQSADCSRAARGRRRAPGRRASRPRTTRLGRALATRGSGASRWARASVAQACAVERRHQAAVDPAQQRRRDPDRGREHRHVAARAPRQRPGRSPRWSTAPSTAFGGVHPQRQVLRLDRAAVQKLGRRRAARPPRRGRSASSRAPARPGRAGSGRPASRPSCSRASARRDRLEALEVGSARQDRGPARLLGQAGDPVLGREQRPRDRGDEVERAHQSPRQPPGDRMADVVAVEGDDQRPCARRAARTSRGGRSGRGRGRTTARAAAGGSHGSRVGSGASRARTSARRRRPRARAAPRPDCARTSPRPG